MMSDASWYRIAADAVLYLHALFVVFVVGGLLLIIIGKLRGWNWVYGVRFRITHLLAIAIVVLQAWLGAICPLTQWEMALRARAGEATYGGAFIAHWVEELLYYHLADWIFTLVYSIFGALVIASWYWVRPQR
jgi:hypothetical protein